MDEGKRQNMDFVEGGMQISVAQRFKWEGSKKTLLDGSNIEVWGGKGEFLWTEGKYHRNKKSIRNVPERERNFS